MPDPLRRADEPVGQQWDVEPRLVGSILGFGEQVKQQRADAERANPLGDEVVSRAVPAAAAPMREQDEAGRAVRHDQLPLKFDAVDGDRDDRVFVRSHRRLSAGRVLEYAGRRRVDRQRSRPAAVVRRRPPIDGRDAVTTGPRKRTWCSVSNQDDDPSHGDHRDTLRGALGSRRERARSAPAERFATVPGRGGVCLTRVGG